MKKLVDGKCPDCGGTTFYIDEVLSWKGSTHYEGAENVTDVHFFKCYDSSTQDMTCENCAAEIDVENTEFYFHQLISPDLGMAVTSNGLAGE